jgi:hypothetical protein
MIDVNPEAYMQFGRALERVAEQWDAASHKYKNPMGTIMYHHEMISEAYRDVVLTDKTLPYRWLHEQSAIYDGMGIFSNLAFLKAGAAGYGGLDKADLHSYMMNSDSLQYAVGLASGPSLAAGRTETDLGMKDHNHPYASDNAIVYRDVQVVDGRFLIPRFKDVHEDHLERAEKKGLDRSKRCQAMMHQAFPTIYRAVMLLSVNSSAADSIYDHYSGLR